MKYFDIIKESSVNGPGNRLVLWLSGCYRRCKGCFNKDASMLSLSRDISAQDVVNMLIKDIHTGISVSGGEPFYQDDELCILLKLCREKGFDTLVFSGYTYKEILSHNFKSIRYCDYLVDGRFIDNMPSKCTYTGSLNQRLLRLNIENIAEDMTSQYKDDENKFAEIFIDENGIITTGLLDIL